MLTINFHKAAASDLIGLPISAVKLTDYTGAEKTTPYCLTRNISDCFSSAGYTSSLAQSGIAFGDGEGIPTPEDYTLFGNIITNLSVTKQSESITNGVKKTLTITNNNESSVTIKEVGWFKYFTSGANPGSSSSTGIAIAGIMLDHTMLDEPVVIPAGDIGVVVYTITFAPDV